MKNIIIFLIITFIAIYLAFFAFDKNEMFFFYGYSIYYFISIIFFIWIHLFITTIYQKRNELQNFIYHHKYALIISAILVVLFFFICPPEYRILADETNLLGTSKALYENRDAFVISEEIGIFEKKQVLERSLDKRLILFPYLLQIIHCCKGYSPYNFYILNGFVSFCCLFLLYYLIQRLWGKFLGYISILLLASYPLFIQYSMSAGYDAFNLFWALLSFSIFCYFYRHRSIQNANLLIYTVALLSYTRYECTIMPIFIIPIVLTILCKKDLKDINYSFIVYPLLFIPNAWLMFFANTNSYLQVSENEKAFTIEYFKENLFNALYFFSGLDFNNETVSEIAIIVIFSIIIFTYRFLTEKKRLLEKTICYKLYLIVLIFFLLAEILIKFSYKYGYLTLNLNSRFGIIFLPYLIALAIYFFNFVIKKHSNFKIAVILFTLFICCSHWVNVHKNFVIKCDNSYKILKVMLNFLEENFKNKESFILALDRPVYLAPFDYNVITIERLNKNYKDIINLIKQRKFWNNIVVIQLIQRGQTKKDSILDKNINTESIYEKAIDENLYMKFSLVK